MSSSTVVEDRIENRPAWWRLAEFVKLSHTVFALPFALISMMVAANGWPSWSVFFWILACMVCARTAAMAFNRVMDWEIDQRNPRTEIRHKLVTKQTGTRLVILSSAAFAVACWNLNLLCMILCPVALAIVFFYSVTKRFSSWSHFFLGLALAAAPLGAWAAVRGELWSPTPYLLALVVLLWVFGFDLIYATQDAEFDRKAGLYSFPATYGIPKALQLAIVLHVLSAIAMAAFGWVAKLGWPYGLTWLIAVVGMIYEHKLSRTGDTRKINQAFFQVNAVVSISLLTGVAIHYLFGI